ATIGTTKRRLDRGAFNGGSVYEIRQARHLQVIRDGETHANKRAVAQLIHPPVEISLVEPLRLPRRATEVIEGLDRRLPEEIANVMFHCPLDEVRVLCRIDIAILFFRKHNRMIGEKVERAHRPGGRSAMAVDLNPIRDADFL